MSNILMGVQVVLGILLVISIMPQDSKMLYLQNLVEKEVKLTLNQKENKHFLLELQR